MTLPGAQETVRNHHATLEEIKKYLTGNELIITTVRDHYDAILSWWFLNNCPRTLSKFVDEYSHSHYAKGNELWWLHKKVDFVMRYETLQSDFDLVMISLSLNPILLGYENVTLNKNKNKNHDPEALEKVYARFQEEIKYYEYKFKNIS